MALAVVGAQVARVGGDLIEPGLESGLGALELEHDHDAAFEDDDVGATLVARELVLEDRGVLGGGLVDVEKGVRFALEVGDPAFPGGDLVGAGCGDEVLEAEADDPRFGGAEGREVGDPAGAGTGRVRRLTHDLTRESA
ncbi:MAG: hypothetical protein IPK67_08070 [Planctomycetes bacterium]|nr:hypothetical protein [Planctomycetota bacterium]